MSAERGTRPKQLVVAGIVVATLLAGALLTAIGRTDPVGQPTTQETAGIARPAAPPGSAGPTAEVSGVPVGFARDEQGAVAASIAYATVSGPRCVVQLLCECWLVSGGPGLGELAGGEVAVGAVGSVVVVVDAPVLDEHLGFEEAVEVPAVEQLVA